MKLPMLPIWLSSTKWKALLPTTISLSVTSLVRFPQKCAICSTNMVYLAFMQEFFSKTGNHKLRFKPAYNPYTEVRLLW